ncbi:MAG: DUF4198 domain-containing protein [Pseudomonadota bacterium]
MHKHRHTICFILFFSPTLQAHDFWIEANPFIQLEKKPIEISLMVGEHLTGKSQPNRLNRYHEFNYTRNGQLQEVPGVMGRNPAGIIHDYDDGVFVVTYRSVTRTVRLGAAKFRQYLNEEGLQKHLKHPVLNQQRKVVEHYTRYAKALVKSGQAAGADQTDTVLGHRLELHADRSPYTANPGETFDVQLTFEQKPAVDVLVSAFCAENPDLKQQQRTDSKGMVTIDLDCSGTWLVKAVTMQPSTVEGIDFESFWASLTFEADSVVFTQE